MKNSKITVKLMLLLRCWCVCEIDCKTTFTAPVLRLLCFEKIILWIKRKTSIFSTVIEKTKWKREKSWWKMIIILLLRKVDRCQHCLTYEQRMSLSFNKWAVAQVFLCKYQTSQVSLCKYQTEAMLIKWLMVVVNKWAFAKSRV